MVCYLGNGYSQRPYVKKKRNGYDYISAFIGKKNFKFVNLDAIFSKKSLNFTSASVCLSVGTTSVLWS